MKRHGSVDSEIPERSASLVEASAPPPPPESGYSRKPLEATVDRGLAAKLFALEAEYYQDITFPAKGAEGSSRMIVDVLDSLSIGSGTSIPSDDTNNKVGVFTETLVLSRFKAKSVMIACNTLSGVVSDNKQSSISVSPAPKSDFDTENSAGDGSPGEGGDDAGDIFLYIESIDETNPDAFPLLDARGGRGQNGQQSQHGTGGAPGYGGEGGNVTVVYGSPLKRAVAVIQDALNSLDAPNALLILSALKAIPDQEMKLPSGKTLCELVSDKDPFVSAMQDLFISPPKEGIDPNSPFFKQKLALITDTLSTCIDTFKTRIQVIETDLIYPKILNKAGDTGNYGSGPKGASTQGPNGNKPTDGKIVVMAVTDLSELPWASDDGIDCRTIVSDMQSAMLLQKAKLAYFYGDVSEGSTARETAQAAKILLDRLISRLSFVGKISAPDSDEDPAGVFSRLQSVFNEATAYQTQFDHGLDYYGHTYGEVPLLTLERYQTIVDGLSQNFAEIEKEYSEYFTYLTQNKAEISQLKKAGDKLGAVNDRLEKDQQVLREAAGRTAYDISCMTDLLDVKRAALDTAITRFQGDINTYFNCDFKALLSGLSTIAFAPESAAMWATQAGSWLYNGFTTIPDDSGEAINRDYVVHKVATIQATVDGISEGFKQLNSGLFEEDDPGANKLLAAQADLDKFLNDFATRFKDKAKDIHDAFDTYVSAVIERNNKILSYNAAISLLLKKKRQVKDNEARKEDIETQLANEASPALPELTASMSVFYHTTRDQLLELLYLMCRAYQFRALDNTNLIAKYMSENVLTPATMTQSAISKLYATSDSAGNLRSGIAWEWYRAQEKMGEYQTSDFPPEGSWGALYGFSDPGTIESFKQIRTLANGRQVHSVSLSIPTVFPTSVTDSYLSNMSDIRLTNVRAWLDGLRVVGTDSDAARLFTIDIVHTGHEQIVDPSGKPFSFTHAPVDKVFSYYSDKLPDDPEVFPQKAIFSDKDIKKDGDQPTYALIGPFTAWEVRLTNEYKKKTGILDELEKYKDLPGSYQGLQGKDITCEYPSHSPIVGTVGAVTVTEDGAVTIEILNIIKRKAEILQIEGTSVTSQKVLKGAQVPDPNDTVSFSSDSEGPKLDFSNFTGIRLEFCGKGRGFSE